MSARRLAALGAAERRHPPRWWRAIPLGAVERVLGLAEVATLLWTARRAAGRSRAPTMLPFVADSTG